MGSDSGNCRYVETPQEFSGDPISHAKIVRDFKARMVAQPRAIRVGIVRELACALHDNFAATRVGFVTDPVAFERFSVEQPCYWHDVVFPAVCVFTLTDNEILSAKAAVSSRIAHWESIALRLLNGETSEDIGDLADPRYVDKASGPVLPAGVLPDIRYRNTEFFKGKGEVRALEAARYVGVTRRQIHTYQQDGRIKPGRRGFITVASLTDSFPPLTINMEVNGSERK